MSSKNIKLLRDGGYKYIIGARIKKESGEIMEKIIATEHRNGVFNDIKYPDGDRLIVGYSDERGKEECSRPRRRRRTPQEALCKRYPDQG